jgi:hypothetical protein
MRYNRVLSLVPAILIGLAACTVACKALPGATAPKGTSVPAANQRTPAPTRAEVAAILTAANYTDIAIGSIVQGVGGLEPDVMKPIASENVAFIRAVARTAGASEGIEWTLYFDQQIGWHFIKVRKPTRRGEDYAIALWTKAGFQAVTHPQPMQPNTVSPPR